MQQKKREKQLFLSLCGERDRNILSGQEKMTYSDFERLVYIMNCLELYEYSLEICESYAENFETEFVKMEMLREESSVPSEERSVYTEEEKYVQWIQEFISQVPKDKREKLIKKMQVVAKEWMC